MAKQFHRWLHHLISIAMSGSLLVIGHSALAFNLSGITIGSFFGDPLNAKIDIVGLREEDKSSLNVKLGTSQAYHQAGLDYTSDVASVHLVLKKQANGQVYIQLNSDKPMSHAFLDLLVEVGTTSGKLTKSYTLFLDPPAKAGGVHIPSSTQLLEPSGAVGSNAVIPNESTPTMPSVPVAEKMSPALKGVKNPALPIAIKMQERNPIPARWTTEKKPTLVLSKNIQKNSSQKVRSTYKVALGETAGAIALHNKTPGISVAQVLVAMMRLNPNAFVEHNTNRMKVGALLVIPTQADANKIEAKEAFNVIFLQNKGYSSYRELLTDRGVKKTNAPSSSSGSGYMEAKVIDKSAKAVLPNKLILMRSGAGNKDVNNIAQTKKNKDSQSHEQELEENIGAIKKAQETAALLGVTSIERTTVTQPAGSVAKSTASAKSDAVPVLNEVPNASQVPAIRKKTEGVAAFLSANCWLSAGLGVLVLVILGFIAYFLKKKKLKFEDFPLGDIPTQPSAPEQLVQEDGGWLVDTSTGLGKKAVSVGKVVMEKRANPVAEAAIYIAYGRLEGAIELLHEAIKLDPNNEAAYQKLFEIYEKKGDGVSYAALLHQVKGVLDESNLIWEKIVPMMHGLSLKKDGNFSKEVKYFSSTHQELTKENGFDFVAQESRLDAQKKERDGSYSSGDLQTNQVYKYNGDSGFDSDFDFDLDDGASVYFYENQLIQAEKLIVAGDIEGAKQLILMVLTHADSALKERAQLVLEKLKH